jgi:cytochrome c biogenesis protein
MHGSGMKQLCNLVFIHIASLNFTIILLVMFLLTILTDTMENAIISFVRGVRLPGVTAVSNFLNGYFSAEVHASRWFKMLVILFILNLLACMAKRIPGTLKILAAPASEEACRMPAAPLFEDRVTVAALRPDFEHHLYRLLAEKMPGPAVYRTAERSVFFSQRGKCFHGGFYLAHGGLLIMLAGSLLGQSSRSGEMFLREGDTDDKVFFKKDGTPCFGQLDNRIRLDSCEPVDPPAGTADPAHRTYRSTVTILREGAADTKGVLEGYQTLAAHGIRIGQSHSPDKDGPQLILSVRAGKAGGRRRTVSLRRHQCCSIPETGHTVRLKDVFVSPDQPHALPENTAPATGAPCTATLEVYGKNSCLLYKPLVASSPVDPEQPWGKAYEFLIAGVENIESSSVCMRLIISTEPGGSLIWAGAGIAITGFSLLFLLCHRKIWVAIEKGGDGYSITVAGWASRNPDVLHYYAGLIKDLVRHHQVF